MIFIVASPIGHWGDDDGIVVVRQAEIVAARVAHRTAAPGFLAFTNMCASLGEDCPIQRRNLPVHGLAGHFRGREGHGMTRTTSSALVTAALLAMAGCTSSERPVAPAPGLGGPVAGAPIGGALPGGPADGACNAAAARPLIGQIANLQTTERAEAMTGASDVRILFPNQPVTQEFIATRLTLDTNDENRVTQVRCG
jgi:hypothetical protein